MAPVVVTWSDLAKHCPWSKGQLIGNGIYCAPWHSASSYSFIFAAVGIAVSNARIYISHNAFQILYIIMYI